MNKKIKIGLIFIILIIFSNPTYGLSFGTHVKNNEIDLLRGESGEFKIIFFSRDDEPIRFSMSLKEYPNKFTITYPEIFDLNSESIGDEYILIENEYVKAKTIKLNVGVPTDADLGEHEILLKASSVSQKGQQNSLGVKTEKMFLLKVNVLSDISENKKISKTKSKVDIESEKTIRNKSIIGKENIEEKSIETKRETTPTGMLTLLNDNKMFFWFVFIILIIFSSFLIYKKVSK